MRSGTDKFNEYKIMQYAGSDKGYCKFKRGSMHI